ncbi:MAG: elongation factor Ts [Rhodospirillaceae bacterium]|jgi:elongation factor Ts|nr:elongation factor Ts [Rhodospirillaceae bacterium]
MAEITASLVKELRDITGAGMMDCKKALTEVDGVLDDAVDWLRKAGLAAAAKKAGRVAAEGLVAVCADGTAGAVVEVNAETDFVARNEQFQSFVSNVANIALKNGGDLDAVSTAAAAGGETIAEELKNLIATVGENMSLRRAASLQVSSGVVASYVHNAVAPNLGRIGVLVALESDGDAEKLSAFGRQIAMHIAAAAPRWTDIGDVDSGELERERSILSDQAKASGKPDEIIEKMVEGRLRKFYEEVVLLEQIFVIDGESKIRKAVEAAAGDIGAPVAITSFARFVLGEGIEREEDDFAAEVAAAAKG